MCTRIRVRARAGQYFRPLGRLCAVLQRQKKETVPTAVVSTVNTEQRLLQFSCVAP